MTSRKKPTILIASRSTGKSTELLRLALREHGDIATFSRASAEVFANIARDILGVDPKNIIRDPSRGYWKIEDVTVATLGEFMRRPMNSDFNADKPLYIDELEFCLRSLTYRNREIGGITISMD